MCKLRKNFLNKQNKYAKIWHLYISYSLSYSHEVSTPMSEILNTSSS